jgi:hypothetical protein
MPMLEAEDPHILYYYVSLSPADVLEIHERLCPSQYFCHKSNGEPRLDVFGFKPSYGFEPLSSLSVIFKLARYSPAVGGGTTTKIVDSWHTEAPSKFLTDNFGTYHISRGSGLYPRDAAVAASLLTIVSPDKQAGRFGVPRDLDQIPDETVAFRALTDRRAVSLSLTSILFAPKIEVLSARWSRSFNLVVGNSFIDRLVFWNARLLVPGWLDNDLCCLRVELDQLRNTEFLNILVDFLKYRNRVGAGSGGPPQLAIRSASLSPDELAEALRLVVAAKTWSATRAEPVRGFDEVVPTSEALKAATESNRYIEASPAASSRFTWSAPTARPPANVPDHLSDAPPKQVFTEGYWCNDFSFEHDSVGPRFSPRNHWMLPRRWRMTGAFKVSLSNERTHEHPPSPRRARHGKLAVINSLDRSVEVIEIPGVYRAVRHALAVDGLSADVDARYGRIVPPNKVAWTEPSNEARYLTGVLGMTGGIEHASRLLLHPFLRDAFTSFGGTPNLTADKIAPTINRLKKRARSEALFDLEDEDDKRALADLIVRASRSLKRPIDCTSYDELRDAWKAYREEYWIANPQEEADDKVDWDKHEEASLDACLVGMRRRQMIFQGHQWTCRNCNHKNWLDLSALKPELSCEICKHATQAPVDIRWLFRPNEFLIQSLRDHSVLSLVWTLSALLERSRSSLLFAEPTCFGFTLGSKRSDAEADLLVVMDGQAVLCEVKASWRSLRQAHVVDFVSLARRLRPDIAMLAVMETGAGPAAQLDQARRQLTDDGIKFELLTPDQYSAQDDPYLPSE